MNRTTVILLLCIVLLLVIPAIVSCNCIQFHKPAFEGFEDMSDDMALTEKEREMFNDLRNDKLSDKEVEALIEKGQINEKLIEKFLANIDNKEKVVEDFTVSAYDNESCNKYAPTL